MQPKHLFSTTVYKGYFDLKIDTLQRDDGAVREYTSLVLGINAVSILAQDESGKIIVTREYRPPTHTHVMGLPGGGVESGEDPKASAQRELFEETGYWSDDLTLIGRCFPNPSICNQQIFYFHAKDAKKRGKCQLDPFEFIETELLDETELHQRIRSSVPLDGILCTALWYKSLLSC